MTLSTRPRPNRPAARPTKAGQADRFHLLIDCRDEANQKRLYEQLIKEGFKVRVLVL